jgi:hypothetical protein
MTVLYRGPHGLVTQDAIASDDTGWARIAIAGLTRIHIVSSQPVHQVPGHQALGISALLVAVLTVPVVGVPAVLLAVLLAVAVVVDVILSHRENAKVRWELRAEHAGRPMTLFSSADHREFAQVCRALQRALEHRDDHG